MRILTTTIATVLIFGSALIMIEKNRRADLEQAGRQVAVHSGIFSGDRPHREQTAEIVRAAGRIEGRTEAIELRFRMFEQIAQIHVGRGKWVSAGDVLVSLDSDPLVQERDLAAAMLEEATAKRERLVNGARSSEIEAARQEYRAQEARLWGAEQAYERVAKLSQNHAASRQTLDDRDAERKSLQAKTAAAKARLETLELPPREDDLRAANASVRAAESRLRIAQIRLDRTQLYAPVDGQILAVEAELGELTGPESPQPLITLSDTRSLRAVAEVDEFDALKIRLGQACQITSDGSEGVLATGRIVEIEPHMQPKRSYGQWAGERTDTYSRRVWIDLQKTVDLPVGLPVDVFIEVKFEK